MKLGLPSLATSVVIRCALPVLTILLMAWLAVLATGQWRRSATVAAQRRADEVSVLFSSILAKDMAGAEQAILGQIEQVDLATDPPYDLADAVAHGFAKYPYAESFFVWAASGDEALLFSRTSPRSDRAGTEVPPTAFPVSIVPSQVAGSLASRALRESPSNGRFAFFETLIDGAPHQVVTRFFRADGEEKDVLGVVGFTVNLATARRTYFPDILDLIEGISRDAESPAISLAVIDEKNRLVAENRAPPGPSPVRERRFPLAFFDSSSVPVSDLQRVPIRYWTARVNTSNDPILAAADSSTTRTAVLILVAAALSIAGILTGIVAVRSRMELESMKTEFVTMASHELKTPLAGIRLVGDTLLKRRFTSAESVADYGAVISREAEHLTRLVDKLLTFSRITDREGSYLMEETDVGELVAEALRRLDPRLREEGFQVRSRTAGGLPALRCDREALVQVFENLIENAIKYSDQVRSIDIVVSADPASVRVSIEDRGQGIPSDEMPHVFSRFFRGRSARSSGSGLGLSIVRKIVEDHGGRVSIHSTPGSGTRVTVSLPRPAEVRT